MFIKERRGAFAKFNASRCFAAEASVALYSDFAKVKSDRWQLTEGGGQNPRGLSDAL